GARRRAGGSGPPADGAVARGRHGGPGRVAQSPRGLRHLRCRRRAPPRPRRPDLRDQPGQRGRGRRRERRRPRARAPMTAPPPMPAIPVSADVPLVETPDLRSRFALARRLEALPLVVALILVVVIFQALTGLFLNPRNLVNLLVELAPLAFIAIASTVMILM